MPVSSALTFSTPILGIVALALALAAIGIASVRNLAPPAISGGLFVAGVLLLALAAGGPIWNHPNRGTIAVMVDLSPSTRGARFRDPGYLRDRLNQLIGDGLHELLAFAEANRPLDAAGPFEEMPADQTRFSPPAVDAIVLFSDGRFELPSQGPPTYIVLDDGLENVADASVRGLVVRGKSLGATIANSGAARVATFPDGDVPIATGNFIVSRPAKSGQENATVMLNPGDLWPENDSMSIAITPPIASEIWWVGVNSPDGHFRELSSRELPDGAEQYLAPAAIVIDNQAASDFSVAQLLRLEQYVRDFGRGDFDPWGQSRFWAGGYDGTTLEEMSPLASSPPTPTTRWILLADGSGSMARNGANGKSRWQDVTEAMVHLLPSLPPADPVEIGQFSDAVRGWLPTETAADAAKASLPPGDAVPHGPTNLESSLTQIADESSSTLPTQLLLLSDCDATIVNPAELIRRLTAKKIALNVLAIDRGSALEVIRQICSATGGSVVEQFDARQWIESAKKLSQAARPPSLEHGATHGRYVAGPKLAEGPLISQWNRTWLKPRATLWVNSDKEADVPLAAFWRVGLGGVAAAAFEPDGPAVGATVRAIAAKPRDPRFSVQWENNQERVIVDARKNDAFLNNLSISADLIAGSSAKTISLTQTAPGRYEGDIEYSHESQMAILRVNNQVIDRVVIPGRYPPEFDALGNDHEAMEKLAEMTGGRVVWPSDHGLIDFHWPTKKTAIAPWLCCLGFIAIGAGLLNWRRARTCRAAILGNPLPSPPPEYRGRGRGG